MVLAPATWRRQRPRTALVARYTAPNACDTADATAAVEHMATVASEEAYRHCPLHRRPRMTDPLIGTTLRWGRLQREEWPYSTRTWTTLPRMTPRSSTRAQPPLAARGVTSTSASAGSPGAYARAAPAPASPAPPLDADCAEANWRLVPNTAQHNISTWRPTTLTRA